jgi:hypothetical protein
MNTGLWASQGLLAFGFLASGTLSHLGQPEITDLHPRETAGRDEKADPDETGA